MLQGEVTIEICMYEINKSKLQRTAVTSIPLQTQVCCQSLSPDNEKLMLGCIDGSVVIFDEGRGITHLVKAAFVSKSLRSFLSVSYFVCESLPWRFIKLSKKQ